LRQVRAQLEKMRAVPLQPNLPVLGSTLQQLRAARNTDSQIQSAPSISANASSEVQP
jgi:hypothetical protein